MSYAESSDPDAASETPENPRPQGALRRALHRLTSPDHVLDAEQHQEVVLGSGGTPVSRCADRQQVCVVGTLRTVTIQPRGQSLSLQAELWDGSGSLELIWIGRRRIPGVEPGRTLRAEGRITQRDGHPVMFNPKYELRPTGT